MPVLITLVSLLIFSYLFILIRALLRKGEKALLVIPLTEDSNLSYNEGYPDSFYIILNKKDEAFLAHLSKKFHLEEACFLVHRDN